ncbi:MAG: hypothetical protein O7G87_20645 [bacterium]|nr:hypothetical protein [bacterium]
MIFDPSTNYNFDFNPDAASILAGQASAHSTMHHHTMTSTHQTRRLAGALLE